jgi:hypothetical protein
MNTISNMRRQYENKAMSKLLGTIVLTLSRIIDHDTSHSQNHLPYKENVV